jgi:transposase
VAREKFLGWCGWAARSRLAPFKKLAKTIRHHLDGILAFIATGLSNGPTKGLNGKIRTLTRRAYGFHSASSLIGLIFLCCTGLTLQPVFKSP